IDDGNIRAFARKKNRHRAAYSGIPAGNNGREALQFAAALIVWCQELRLQVHIFFHAWLIEMLPGHGRLGMFAFPCLRRFFALGTDGGLCGIILVLLMLDGALSVGCMPSVIVAGWVI